MMPRKKPLRPYYLMYAILGLVLTAALFALAWTGAPLIFLISVAAAAVIHSLVSMGLELYHHYKKPTLSTFDKIKIGVALAICIVSTFGLMVVFPHIGIPLAGAIVITSIAFSASCLDVIKNFHHYFFSTPYTPEAITPPEQNNPLEPRAESTQNLQQHIDAIKKDHPNLETHHTYGSRKRLFDEEMKTPSHSSKKSKPSDEEDTEGEGESPESR